MSIEKTRSGEWAVRWRDEAGRNRSKTIGRKRDAEAFEAEVKRRARLGALDMLDAGTETLDQYVAATWIPTHAAHLAPRTRALYAALYDKHLGPRLGGVPLRKLNVETIGRWQTDVLAAGGGPHAVRKALKLLGGILQRAAEAGRIPGNPARMVRPAPVPRSAEVRPLAPMSVEWLRRAMRRPRGPSERHWDGLDLGHRDAVLVSLLAYAGLRPQEAIALEWGHVLDRTLVIHAAKTGQQRSVRLLDPLAADLREWQLACGRPGDRAPVIPGADGEPWAGYAKWRGRGWRSAVEALDLGAARPYDLRHSFASLLLHEGRPVHYVARQLGHGAELTLRTYGHVIEELDGQPQVAAETAIRQAREDPRLRLGGPGLP